MNSTITEPETEGFITFEQLQERVPYSPRRLRTLVQDGTIPVIRVPGGRKLIFDWGAVADALRKFSTIAA